MFDFAERFNKLALTDDEIALFSAVVLLSPGTYEPRHDKANKMCTPSEYSDQPVHLPSLIRVSAVRSMGS